MNRKIGDSFIITTICKDDLRELFKDNPLALSTIDNMTDGEMEHFAGKMANDYLEQLYWSSARILFEEYYLKEN